MGFNLFDPASYSWIAPTAGGIYSAVDVVAGGVLPDFGAGSPIPAGVSFQDSLLGGVSRIPANLAGNIAQILPALTSGLPQASQNLGQVPPNLTAGLPQTGQNVGQGLQQVIYYPLVGAGQGAGQGLDALLSGAGHGLGSAAGDVGKGLGSGLNNLLLPAAVVVAGLVAIHLFLPRGQQRAA